MNVVVVTGRLTRPAELRVLASGDRLVSYELSVAPAEGPRESVPVSWPGAPAGAEDVPAGEEVAVLGRVRRRFFRTGGTTASRTEVVAERVVVATDARRVRALVSRARTRLAS